MVLDTREFSLPVFHGWSTAARFIIRVCFGILMLALFACQNPETSGSNSSGSSKNGAPSTPTGLIATNATVTSLTITWNPVSGATSYQLFRTNSYSGPFTDLIYSGTGTTFTDTGLTSGNTYFYEIEATDSSGSSSLSTPASGTTIAVTPPSTPSNLSVGGFAATSLTITWSSASGASSYQLLRATISSGPFTQIFSGAGTTFTDTGLTTNTTYYYEVQATNTAGSSPLSSAVPGTTVANNNIYMTIYSGGLSVSTDGAANWTNYTTANGLTSYVGLGVFASGSTIYAATGYLGPGQGGLSISTNGGSSWTTYSNSTSSGFASLAAVGVYASGPNVYVATGSGVSISTTGGSSWTTYTTSDGLASNAVQGVYVSGSTIYAATQGGLSVSTTGGTSWTNYTTANGLGSNVVLGVYASGSTIYAATNGGLSVSTNSGTTWTTVSSLPATAAESVYASGSTIYVGTMNGLEISTNGGQSWTTYAPDGGDVRGVYAQ